MLISPTRERDRATRNEMLRLARTILHLYGKYRNPKYLDAAKLIAKAAQAIKEKMETYDYTADDKLLSEIHKRWGI